MRLTGILQGQPSDERQGWDSCKIRRRAMPKNPELWGNESGFKRLAELARREAPFLTECTLLVMGARYLSSLAWQVLFALPISVVRLPRTPKSEYLDHMECLPHDDHGLHSGFIRRDKPLD
ncbi:hypothetical protein F5Y19DRAFT_471005 [Xylariaceae sp. FL1651]|nr:hypothetical protein F5Y19DRAFT_471005 [Xylariaceae sp. FL1651]